MRNVSAYYIFQLQNTFPTMHLAALTRGTVTLILVVLSLLFERTHLGFSHNGLFHFLSLRNFALLFLNAFLSGVVANYIDGKIEKILDPLSQKATSFFEPLMGTLIAFFFNLVRGGLGNI